MRDTTFARRAVRFAGIFAFLAILAACGSPTDTKFPGEEEEDDDDPIEGVIDRR